MMKRGMPGEIVNLPNGVDAKITRVGEGVVHGVALWPGHPDPIRFWTSQAVWESLISGEIPTALHGPRLVAASEAS